MTPSGRWRCYASTCGPGDCGGPRGWSRPYIRRGPQEYQAVVVLYVVDPSGSGYSAFLPFVIDTGTSLTIIPRDLLQHPRAFRAGPRDLYQVNGVSGSPIFGHKFPAALSLSPNRSECSPLLFRDMEVFIPDACNACRIQMGLLGLDALRQVETVFDASHVTLKERTLSVHGAGIVAL